MYAIFGEVTGGVEFSLTQLLNECARRDNEIHIGSYFIKCGNNAVIHFL